MTVQQLDKNMSNLRTWLSRIETELAKPVVYNVCHSDEIQRKLAEQQVGQDAMLFKVFGCVEKMLFFVLKIKSVVNSHHHIITHE